MAHNINIVDGKAAFFSLRESAWHKLGQVVERPVTDEQAQQLAGLGWDVTLEPLCRQDMQPIETHVATMRSDTRETLGIVGTGYTPVQNTELFKWLRGLGEVGNVTIETAGALGAGEVVWVLGRCEGLKLDLGDGGVQPYLTLINGHSGNRKLTIMPTTVRIVCANTLRMAESVGKRQNTLSTGYQIRHTSGITEAIESVRKAYARTAKAWENTSEVLTALAKVPLTEAKLKRIFTEPWIPKVLDGEPEAATTDESTRAATIRMEREKRLRNILASGTCSIKGNGDLGNLADTLYGAAQAGTEYVDHESVTRTKTGTVEAQTMARFESANFGGTGDLVKERIWNLALELAGA